MKKIRFFIVLLLVFFLVSCDSFGTIKNDFENAGYTYSEEAKQYIDDLLEEFEDDEIVVRPHVFKKTVNIAIVLEFESTEEMEKQIDESKTLKGFLKDLQKSEYVRGDCLLIPIGLNQTEMVQIFNGEYNNKK